MRPRHGQSRQSQECPHGQAIVTILRWNVHRLTIQESRFVEQCISKSSPNHLLNSSNCETIADVRTRQSTTTTGMEEWMSIPKKNKTEIWAAMASGELQVEWKFKMGHQHEDIMYHKVARSWLDGQTLTCCKEFQSRCWVTPVTSTPRLHVSVNCHVPTTSTNVPTRLYWYQPP